MNVEEISTGALYNCSDAHVGMVTSNSDLCAYDGKIDQVLQAMSSILAHGKSLHISISRQIFKSMDILTTAKGNLLVPGGSIDIGAGNVRFQSSSVFLLK